MTEKPVQIIVTPGSGEGRAGLTARRLRRRLAHRHQRAVIHSFENLPALMEWAETCEPDFSRLVCIGGDATQSAAARAAMRHGIPFVPVPNGFGNIFASVFGHPKRARDIAALLETGEVRRVDVGVVSTSREEVFLSHRSFGFLEQIQQVAERGRKQPQSRSLRLLWYFGVAYRFLFRVRLASYTVEIDGAQVADDAVLVTVANVETYRGFLPLTPAAVPVDGLFDVAIVPRVSKPVLFAGLSRLRLGRWARWNGLQVHRGRRVVVTTPRRREELTVRRGALPLLVRTGAVEEVQRRAIEEEPPLPA